MFWVTVCLECLFFLSGDTHTHCLWKVGVYAVDSVNDDRSCWNWGKKLGQERCHADINNLVETVGAWGEGV